MTAAINFDGHRPATDTPAGIDVATREFLRAYFRYAKQPTFPCVCPDDTAFTLFKEYAAEDRIAPDRCVSVNQNDASALEAANCLMRYDPGFVRHVWARRYHGQRRYSICGIAHASSTDTVMDTIGAYATAPLQSWDALICPSRSIRTAIGAVLGEWQDYLKARTGSLIEMTMQLPVIPLGVDSQKFDLMTDDVKRREQRRILGLSDDEIAVLYVGRLNYISKANPLALLLGLEEVAKKSDCPVHLIFYGHFNDDQVNEDVFQEAIDVLSHASKVTFVRHGDPDYPNGLWAAADIFCSLADNIQESFGLTPVEAMAAGLPVIASDWNGYRETVRQGIDGFTIPTIMPPAGAGADLAYKYFSRQNTYGDYLGGVSQSTAVDIAGLVEALINLVGNRDLRSSMGLAGKKRAAEIYDWAHIIGQYEELWQDLRSRRQRDEEVAPPATGNAFFPSRPDPFKMFADFASQSIADNGGIDLVVTDWSEAIKRIGLKSGLVNAEALIELEELPLLIGFLESNPEATIGQMINALPRLDRHRLYRTLVWLIKLGICRYRP